MKFSYNEMMTLQLISLSLSQINQISYNIPCQMIEELHLVKDSSSGKILYCACAEMIHPNFNVQFLLVD